MIYESLLYFWLPETKVVANCYVLWVNNYYYITVEFVKQPTLISRAGILSEADRLMSADWLIKEVEGGSQLFKESKPKVFSFGVILDGYGKPNCTSSFKAYYMWKWILFWSTVHRLDESEEPNLFAIAVINIH